MWGSKRVGCNGKIAILSIVVAAREGALNVCTLVVVQAERLLTETHSSHTQVRARPMVPPTWHKAEAALILSDLYALGRDRPSLGGRRRVQQTTRWVLVRGYASWRSIAQSVSRVYIERRRRGLPPPCQTDRRQRRAPLRDLLVPITPPAPCSTRRDMERSLGDDAPQQPEPAAGWRARRAPVRVHAPLSRSPRP